MGLFTSGTNLHGPSLHATNPIVLLCLSGMFCKFDKFAWSWSACYKSYTSMHKSDFISQMFA